MKLTFLGTGAADVLREVKEDVSFGWGNKSVRRYSSTLLDDKLLFDCSIFTLGGMDLCKKDKSKIEHLLITHFHSDHINFECVKELAKNTEKPLSVWHLEGAIVPEIENAVFHPLKSGVPTKIGEYTVTALNANHDCFPAHYVVEKDNKKIFYGLDGAWLLHDTYYAMKDAKFDAMIMDATVGDYDGDYRMAEHNSIPMIRSMEKSFKVFGIVGENTKIILSHLATSLHKPHDETEELVKNDGYIVAFDGLEMEI